jgi:cyclopropane-fatty-acyl-phospholipid synthase
MNLQNINNQVLFKVLERAKFGSIGLKFMDPRTDYKFGEGPQVAEIFVKNGGVLNEIVSGGDIELAAAIINEDIIVSDEAAFIDWACKNDDVLKSTFHGKFLGTLAPRIKGWLRPNTIKGAKKNIIEHYDLGNDFYNTWLDSTMSYSSAIFSSESKDDLKNAQIRKYDRIIDELNITSNDQVLEIGCGWGGFFSRAVERTGCKVTAVMNSPSQAAFNRELIQKNHFNTNVDLQLIDYRQIEGKFDKVVSIEMIEAVGEKYWPVYFSKISNSLHAKGRALIQSITIKDSLFKDYRRNPNFINTMVFPGGMLLTNSNVENQAKLAGMHSEHKPFEFGLSYAKTLRLWRENFLLAQKENLLPDLDKKFVNLWRFYLSYCEGAFTAKRINVAHFSLQKT